MVIGLPEEMMSFQFLTFLQKGLRLKSLVKWCAVLCGAGLFLLVMKYYPSAMKHRPERMRVSPEERYMGTSHQITTTQPQYNNSEGSDIILLAYPRTGSTFIGNVLGWRPDVFYWLEPLRTFRLWYYIRDKDLLCSQLQPLCNIIPEADKRSLHHALSFLDDIFHCRLAGRINETEEFNYYPENAVPSWRNHINCSAASNKRKLHPKCVSYLVENCHKASHRMARVTRIDLKTVSAMLDNNPRLKIVHLLRDPRGIINSRLRTFWYAELLKTNISINDNIQVMCSRLRNNIATGNHLINKYPNRVKFIQYEDDFNVKSPAISKLYEFIGINAPAEVHANEIDKLSLPYYAERTQKFNPFLYRKQLPWHVLAMVNNHCKDVLAKMGLRMFSSEAECRNESLPVIYSKLTYTIL